MPYKIYVSEKKIMKKEEIKAIDVKLKEDLNKKTIGGQTAYELPIIEKNQPVFIGTKDTVFDPVERPKHYNMGKIEVSDFIADQKLNFFEGNCIKYICRHKYKNGLEDLRKANWYLTKLIKLSEESNIQGEEMSSQKLEKK